MFKRSFASRDRAAKATKLSKRSFRDETKRRMLETMDSPAGTRTGSVGSTPQGSPSLTSAIVTLVVGPDRRLFAAHEEVLAMAPFFADALRGQFFESAGKRLDLPDDDPQVLSAVLEYLYKGDYAPRLLHDKRRRAVALESPRPDSADDTITSDPTIFLPALGESVLRDTAIYCAAQRYGLPELQRLALRKQGLQSGVDVATVLRSARFAYAFTPDSDSRLRAHFLALIIRSRRTFKRSGTMQLEMEIGGKLFFDLFVAMCNHMDDIEAQTA